MRVAVFRMSLLLIVGFPLYAQTKQATMYFAEARQEDLRDPLNEAIGWIDKNLQYLQVGAAARADFTFQEMRFDPGGHLQGTLLLKGKKTGEDYEFAARTMKYRSIKKALAGLLDLALFGESGHFYRPVKMVSCLNMANNEVQITIAPGTDVGFERAEHVTYDFRHDREIWLEMRTHQSYTTAVLEVRGAAAKFLQNDCPPRKTLYLVPRLSRATRGELSE